MERSGDLRKLIAPYRVDDGKRFRLRRCDPGDTCGLDFGKKNAREMLERGARVVAEQQEMLYAQDRWSLLLIFQAMDAAGKDSAIKHVMSGVNPQGCQVTSFKQPSAEELDHDFLWRTSKALPERGRIGIFNRSYYEEVLVVRVHPELLDRQRLPARPAGKRIWEERFSDIRAHERHLSRNGTVIRKFFLHVSKDEQKRRFLDRLTEPEKHWKFSAGDVAERGHWDAYMAAYEDAIRHTSAPDAPWFVVPADNKWFTRLVVMNVVLDALKSLKLHYPRPDAAALAALGEAREGLLRE